MQWGVMKGDNASWVEDIDFCFLLSRSLYPHPRCRFNVLSFSHFPYISPAFISDPSLSLSAFLCLHFSLLLSPYFPLCTHTLLPTHTICLLCFSSDPGAVVETHSAVPYAVIGGVLALLVFTVICVLIVTIWCSVRQKGNTHTHTNTTQKFLSHVFGNQNILSHFSQARFLISPLSGLTSCEKIIAGQLHPDSLKIIF